MNNKATELVIYCLDISVKISNIEKSIVMPAIVLASAAAAILLLVSSITLFAYSQMTIRASWKLSSLLNFLRPQKMLVVTTVIPNLELQIFRSLKLNTNAIMQSKLYEFKGPDKIYRLALIVSNLFTSNS